MDPLVLLIIVLLVLYVGGLGVGYTLGGLIHVLLLVLVVVIIVRLIQGRKPL